MKKATEERRFRWHWQDLRVEDNRQSTGFVTEGRAWFYALSNCFHIEWYFGSRKCALTAEFSNRSFSEDAILLHFAIPFILNFYFGVERADWVKSLPGIGKGWQDGTREIGFSWYDGYLSLMLWCRDGNEWNRGDRWWHFKQPIMWNPTDFFLGRDKYSDENLEVGTINIVLPEGEYEAIYRLFRSTWKRPRWPWPRHLLRGEIEVDRGVPVPGKGENSWDLDDTAIYSMTCPAATKEEVAAKYIEAVMKKRKKYGWGNG
jgi:hypothetical protein